MIGWGQVHIVGFSLPRKLPILAPKAEREDGGTRLLGAKSNTGILRLRSGLELRVYRAQLFAGGEVACAYGWGVAFDGVDDGSG